MQPKIPKSYSKYTQEDLKLLGLQTTVVNFWDGLQIPDVEPSPWLVETLRKGSNFSLFTEKSKSEFIIAPILNELHELNKGVFNVYSGYNFTVDKERGLQGFCDFLLAKPPLNIVPDSPIIAVVEAKLNDVITAAVPQCAAEMYATRIWNDKKGQHQKYVYGIITTGNSWVFLRLNEGVNVEINPIQYSLNNLEQVLGALQHIVNQYK